MTVGSVVGNVFRGQVGTVINGTPVAFANSSVNNTVIGNATTYDSINVYSADASSTSNYVVSHSVDGTVTNPCALQGTATGCNVFPYNVQSPAFLISTNCGSSASPAVCGSSAAGAVNVAASAVSVTVNTTATTANSQVQLTFDSSLGTKLGVTCNTTPVMPTITARTAGTGFVLSVPTAPTTNPACFSYTITN